MFAIDVAAHASMFNHFHVVMRVDSARPLDGFRDEVIARWTALFAGPPLVQRHLAGESLLNAELTAIDEVVDA